MENRDWIKEFYSYGTLIKPTPEQEKLLIENGPLELYQYRGGSKKDLENLENGIIWASAADRFNDPFDCDLNLKEFDEYCNAVMIRNPSKKFENSANELKRYMASMRSSTAVSCLSEKHDLILMWSHYANKHQGICLCYGVADLLNTHKIIMPVWYRSEKITPFVKDGGKVSLNKRIKEIFIQKSPEWSYEEEWRLIELVEEDNYDRFKFMHKNKGVEIKDIYPERIILGAKVSDELKKEVLRIAKAHSITVTQMQMCDDEFKLIEMNIDV